MESKQPSPSVKVRLRQGHVIEMLRQMPEASVHCVITSPPYFGLRNYDTEPQVWLNGSDGCAEHAWSGFVRPSENKRKDANSLQLKSAYYPDQPQAVCTQCGAWRGNLGLEPTPDLYVEHLVQIFREVRRVLRKDGTLWLVIADSYAGSNGGKGDYREHKGKQQDIYDFDKPQSRFGKGEARPSDIRANLGDFLHRLIEGGIIFIASRGTLTITAKSEKVLKFDNIAPDLKLSRFLGVKRILFKKRDDDLCQVLNLLDAKRDVWISSAVSFVVVNDATLEIVVDELDGLRVIISDSDLQPATAVGVFTVGANAGENPEIGFAIAEPREPVTKIIRNIQPVWDTSTFDSFGKRFLQVDSINEPIAFADTFDERSCGLSNFRVTKTTQEHLALSLMKGLVEVAIDCVRHLFISNKFGSLMRYGELYDKTMRLSNALGAKQEIGIPDMVKRALMEDGWTCRSTIIWNKPNSMPESVQGWRWEPHRIKVKKSQRGNEAWRVGSATGSPQMDHGGHAEWKDCPGCAKCDPNDGFVLVQGSGRVTDTHEYVYMFSKSKRYYYDTYAIAEMAKYDGRKDIMFKGSRKDYNNVLPNGKPDALAQRGHARWISDSEGKPMRNKRSVWTIKPQPYRGAHYATFPEKLVEPCLLAGTSEYGVCAKCGAPWVRVIERGEPLREWQNVSGGDKNGEYHGAAQKDYAGALAENASGVKARILRGMVARRTVGWRPSCQCHVETVVPATVLDPFSGSGTTGIVAVKRNRNYIGIELKEEYIPMSRERITLACGGMFMEFEV